MKVAYIIESAHNSGGMERVLIGNRTVTEYIDLVTALGSFLLERKNDRGRIIAIHVTYESTDLHVLPPFAEFPG